MRVLEARCGAEGYHYTLGSAGQEQESGKSNSVALEAMANRLRAEEPERVNPPGPKISDKIALIAAPLLEAAPDYVAKRSILMLAASAWNYTVLPLAAQEETLADLAETFPDPEAMGTFACLVARTIELFPDERRLICKVETNPGPEGDLELRVVSVM